jgi:DNA-nicking Smr family endonuclease
MRKRKSPDQKPADFKNNPFKTLKGITPPPAGRETRAAPVQRKEEKEEDAEELFLQAVAGARKIENDAAPAPRSGTPKIPDRIDDAAPQDQQLFLQAMQKIGAAIKDPGQSLEEEPEAERRSPSSRMKQLKRGTIRIGSELDLHGFLRDEALVRLDHFIRSAYARGLEAVLVITGKGVNSAEGPVLQGAAAAWLRDRGKGMVAEFSPAPRDRGGSGAYVVFLKKK